MHQLNENCSTSLTCDMYLFGFVLKELILLKIMYAIMVFILFNVLLFIYIQFEDCDIWYFHYNNFTTIICTWLFTYYSKWVIAFEKYI